MPAAKPAFPVLARGPLAVGLVAGWPFWEGSGLSLNDLSGQSNTGTFNGTTTWVGGQSGWAINTDGSTGYISVPDSPSLDLSGPFTIACWSFMNAKQTNFCPVVSKEGAISVNSCYYLGFNNVGSGQVYFGLNHGANEIDINQPSFNVWHHVVGVFTGSGLILYYDGAVAGSGGNSTAPRNAAVALNIGFFLGGPTFFNGSFDGIGIWNRALSANEVAALYSDSWAMYRRRRVVMVKSGGLLLKRRRAMA